MMSTTVDDFQVVYANQIHIPWWVTAICVIALLMVVLFLVLLLTRKRR